MVWSAALRYCRCERLASRSLAREATGLAPPAIDFGCLAEACAVKRSSSLGFVRQLCCLGLGGQLIMPRLLEALHEIVPSDSNGFFWVGDGREMSHLYAEKILPRELIDLYFTDFYRGRGAGAPHGFADLVASPADVQRAQLGDEFYRSDYYNLIWRCLDAHHVMYAVVREGHRALGLLSLYRSAKDPPFTLSEAERLAGVLRYIAHGLRPGLPANAKDDDLYEEGRSGLLVFDREGRLQHASREGSRLLFLATHPRIDGDTVRCAPTVPPALAALCRKLYAALGGRPTPPPVLQHDTPWGRFTFRAYPMEGMGTTAQLIGVLVEQREPLQIGLARRMKALPLSAKQQAVCLALAQNRTHGEVAERLNISLNTVNYHVKEIYTKLDVHDRSGMVERLLASGGRTRSTPR
jgi:DNA-binding CsgD family transcriptional regulator